VKAGAIVALPHQPAYLVATKEFVARCRALPPKGRGAPRPYAQPAIDDDNDDEDDDEDDESARGPSLQARLRSRSVLHQAPGTGASNAPGSGASNILQGGSTCIDPKNAVYRDVLDGSGAWTFTSAVSLRGNG
jgi:hypothetical protein